MPCPSNHFNNIIFSRSAKSVVKSSLFSLFSSSFPLPLKGHIIDAHSCKLSELFFTTGATTDIFARVQRGCFERVWVKSQKKVQTGIQHGDHFLIRETTVRLSCLFSWRFEETISKYCNRQVILLVAKYLAKAESFAWCLSEQIAVSKKCKQKL